VHTVAEHINSFEKSIEKAKAKVAEQINSFSKKIKIYVAW
jgi:hypothetical protein